MLAPCRNRLGTGNNLQQNVRAYERKVRAAWIDVLELRQPARLSDCKKRKRHGLAQSWKGLGKRIKAGTLVLAADSHDPCEAEKKLPNAMQRN